ncbi:UCH-domain-containing protein [Byssothecium circinans]|uniref:ubiquitinyl hydrolase 1 n=1 Tax=Byssothecium circinans TaxID=147558 RepID=A0A6A5UAU5_9PLEO|nr:UCH-domain-containing protein [Byssothecium circinans]
MDPESVAFQPRDDFWRIQGEMLRVQQSQAELADRVSRLEQRHESDSRLKNVWGTSSPFPSVLGGTPLQVPLEQPTAEHFSNFDHHTSNLIGNLQLDAEDEPRRIGTTSRANSVRFDETADYGRWAHASRSSLDLIPRTGSGMGGHAMSERSYSHKSVGGQSSTGQSVHSATSGRANSLTGYGLNTAGETPGLAPGLFILGSVPAIIRCWLTTTFKHDTMLYAAVCTGSFASYLDLRLIRHLGFQDQISRSEDDTRKIKLPVYLPEAIPVSASSRSSSPAPQLPSLTIEFTVVEHDHDGNDKAIQIFFGSDMMRAHNADVLFSSNQLTLYDDDRSKLRIPLVRPEDERAFKSLYTSSGIHSLAQPQIEAAKSTSISSKAEGYGQDGASSNGQPSSTAIGRSNGTTTTSSSDDGSMGRRSLELRPHLGVSTIRSASKDPQDSNTASATPRSGPSSAIWNNWRRDTEKTSIGDWAHAGKPLSSTYQRRDTGIKVLKKPGTRTLSTSISQGSSPAGQSRFFDDGKRRDSNVSEAESTAPILKRSVSGEKTREMNATRSWFTYGHKPASLQFDPFPSFKEVFPTARRGQMQLKAIPEHRQRAIEQYAQASGSPNVDKLLEKARDNRVLLNWLEDGKWKADVAVLLNTFGEDGVVNKHFLDALTDFQKQTNVQWEVASLAVLKARTIRGPKKYKGGFMDYGKVHVTQARRDLGREGDETLPTIGEAALDMSPKARGERNQRNIARPTIEGDGEEQEGSATTPSASGNGWNPVNVSKPGRLPHVRFPHTPGKRPAADLTPGSQDRRSKRFRPDTDPVDAAEGGESENSAIGSGEESAVASSWIPTVCYNCRGGRTGCDKKLPSCSSCVAFGRTCNYPGITSTPKRQPWVEVEAQEEHKIIAETDATTTGAEGSSHADRNRPAEDAVEEALAPANVQPAAREEEETLTPGIVQGGEDPLVEINQPTEEGVNARQSEIANDEGSASLNVEALEDTPVEDNAAAVPRNGKAYDIRVALNDLAPDTRVSTNTIDLLLDSLIPDNYRFKRFDWMASTIPDLAGLEFAMTVVRVNDRWSLVVFYLQTRQAVISNFKCDQVSSEEIKKTVTEIGDGVWRAAGFKDPACWTWKHSNVGQDEGDSSCGIYTIVYCLHYATLPQCQIQAVVNTKLWRLILRAYVAAAIFQGRVEPAQPTEDFLSGPRSEVQRLARINLPSSTALETIANAAYQGFDSIYDLLQGALHLVCALATVKRKVNEVSEAQFSNRSRMALEEQKAFERIGQWLTTSGQEQEPAVRAVQAKYIYDVFQRPLNRAKRIHTKGVEAAWNLKVLDEVIRGMMEVTAQAPGFKTASTKKRKIAPAVPAEHTRHESSTVTHSPDEGTPRSSPPPSYSTRASDSPPPPPRYLPPHLHNEVYDTAHDSNAVARDGIVQASSPSEACAHLTLDSEPMAADSDRTRPTDHKPPPRSASPAKRPHSDMDGGDMDVDGPSSARRNSGQSSPRPTKPMPTPQRSLRATSIDMADATSNASSDPTSASNADSAATSVTTPPASALPSLDEQVGKVLALSRKQPQDGQVGYIVSHSWLERVWARTPQYADKQREFSKSATEGDIGPVDNSNLVDTAALVEDLADQRGEDFVPLRPGVSLEQDYEVLPAEAWELILSWYGIREGTPVIRRYAHDTSPDQFTSNIQYELNPPIFTIRKVRKTAPSTLEASKKLVASRSDNLIEFINAAKRAAGIHVNHKVRVWRILNAPAATDPPPSQQPSGMLTPEASPPPTVSPPPVIPPLIIDAASLSNLDIGTQREEVTGKDEAANETFNDKLNLSGAGLAEDQVLVLEEQDENGEYITGALSKVVSKTGGSKAGAKGIKSTTNSGRSTPAPSGPMTRGRTRNGRVRGTTGLTNLGNTCYMNSALQCIRSVEELAIYFLSTKYKREINTDNPLGHNGNIARAYAGLMASIYDEGGTPSFAPKNFKNTLGRAQPIFSGYGQQDSQEFLSFLVDGLHEDLNRIHKKPYTEYPESDDNTHRDPEAIKALGEKFRAIHHARNDSVAMDLFNGFYKNTMVCPDCAKVSITFDPYSLVTLQLPIEQTWQHKVRFIPLHGKIWDVEVDIDKNATIKNVKEFVGKHFGVDGGRIMASEVYSSKYYKHFEDNSSLSESGIQQRDEIYLYELDGVGSNWPPPKSKKKKSYYPSFNQDAEADIPDPSSSAHDKIVVPLFNRIPSNSSAYRASSWSLKLWPSYILVDREEAKDYDAILKKVLGKVAQMTTRDIFADSYSSSLAQSRSGSDVVLTTEDDASPNGDPRVQDGSVEGEDNMVEVTMTDPAETPENASSDDKVPEVLRPGTFIPPEFRQLFEMKHTPAGNSWVPTGWSSIDGTKNFQPIAKRIRVPSSRESSVQSLEDASNPVSSDEDDNPQFSADARSTIEAAEQSSDEDEVMQPSEPPSRNGRSKNYRHMSKRERKRMHKEAKFNKKKGKANRLEQPSQSGEQLEDEDDERLIKLGEAIILDWNPDAYDALFGGINANDSRGMDAGKFVETLEDEELEKKRERRKARKRNGITLDECFAETSKSEVLSEDNAWYCNRCKDLRRATKTLEIWTAPDILVVHLKRFSSHRAFRDKVDALVDFPVEGLDLAGKVGLPEDKELIYDLFAVDNHYGGLGGGHYTAYAKNFFDQQWYDYNDSSVSKCGPGRVVSAAAYLLFYRRRSAGPLGPPALQEIVNTWRDPEYEGGEQTGDEANSRNPSPSGNGLRLGESSRNGSSSAFGAGAGALRGGGSAGVGSPALNEVGAETLDDEPDDAPPSYEDEGYVEGLDLQGGYGPMNNYTATSYTTQEWSFATVDELGDTDANLHDAFHADDASDGPQQGSPLGERMRDFEDDDFSGLAPGQSTPLGQDEEIPLLGQPDDGEVAEISLEPDES